MGEALWERCVYERETGQLQSATFMDYAMPRADVLPMFASEISEVPSTSNPLGLRGGSEGGMTPALASVGQCRGGRPRRSGRQHVDLPATPERVWNAIRAARRPA